MKKIVLCLVMIGLAWAGLAQKPTITIWASQNGQMVSVNATQAVPETIYCAGQYQAPSSTTGYWYLNLPAGSSYAHVYAGDLVYGTPIPFDWVSVNGVQYKFGDSPFQLETSRAIYVFVF